MRWAWGVSVGTGVAILALSARAQRSEAPVEWLPPADSLPAGMATLVIVDRESRAPVEYPWFCVDPGGGWMVGMPDGRVRFSQGGIGDTVRLRISGPWHEVRAVALPWALLEGRGAIIPLTRRSGGRVEPTC